MTERRARIGRLLHDLVAAVAADGGAAVYLDDGEGALQLVARSENADEGRFSRFRFMRSRRENGRTLLVAIPDVHGGVLVLERKRGAGFTSEDRALARLYARQVADQVAVDGLQPRSTIWTRQLEAIQAVAAQLTRLNTLEQVAIAICVETQRVIEHDNARVYVVASDNFTLEPVAFRSTHPAYAGETADGLRLHMGQGITGWVAERGTPQIVPDAARDPRVLDVPNTPEVVEESMLVVPMRHENQVIGVIVLSRLGLDRFDDDDLRLLQVLSDQAAVAIENARLLAGRDRLVAELEALLEISQATSLADDEADLAKVICRKLAEATKSDACIVSRWDEASAMLHTLGSHGRVTTDESYDVLEYPLSRRVLRDGVPALVQADASDADPAELRLMRTIGAKTLLMLPLTAAGRVTGLVELIAMSDTREYTAYELNVYRTMANQAAAVLENASLVEQLRQAADVDQVTSVNNHRYLQERLKQEAARSARTHSPFSVLMVDLDGFKSINDKHGHADGDRVLRNVANDLRLAVRTNDIVARYGGDEFVVLMPDTDESQAKVVARRVIEEIRARKHQLSDGSAATVSASAGLAVYPEDGRSPQTLLKAADAAMYTVKRSGGSDVRRGTRQVRAAQARLAAGGVNRS